MIFFSRKELKRTILLMLCFKAVFLLCDVNHPGWPFGELLATIGFITLLISVLQFRCLSVMTIIGYIAGNVLGEVFQTRTHDPAGAILDNLWFIWMWSYLFLMLLGVALDIIMNKKKKTKNILK